MVQRVVKIILEGEESVSPAADKASKSLGGLEKAAVGFLTVALAKKAAEAANEVVRLGAHSLMARDRLNAFAGGSANAAKMVDALIASSDGVIDRLTATEKAARLLQMGVVDTAGEMGMAGAIVGKLGDQTLSLENRMQTFTMMMANQSKLRLDTFGLSVERVTDRQKALEDQGYSTEEAFKTAVFEEAEVALDKLGDTSDTAATKMARFEASLKNLKTAAAEAAVESEAFGAILEDIDWRTTQMNLQATQREMMRLGVLTQGEVDRTNKQLQSITGLIATRKEQEAQIKAMEAVMEDYTSAIAANAAAEELAAQVHGRTVGETVEYHYRVVEAVEAEVEALDYLDAAQVKVVLSAQVAARRRAEQLEDFARRAEDLERSHQETIASIIASGQQSAASIARDAHQERLAALNTALQAEQSALRQSQQARMAALNEALQAELTALAEGITQRNFQASLESMERQHRSRIQSIRDSAIESEESAENRRFKGVMNRLNKEQQARMAALRARYGKGEDADSQRESLEEEHRRRMMGLYTKSAREQERKRYEDALKELAFKEEEAALLEDFQDEKESAETAHRDELDGIRRDDIQRQIDEENKRYADAVAEAHRQQALRAQDAAARNAITERYAAERAARAAQDRSERVAQEASHNAQRIALEAQLKAQLDAIRQAEIVQRIAEENAAHAKQQEDLQRSRSRAEATFRESQARMRIATIAHWYEMGLISAAGAQAMYEAALRPGTEGVGPRPWERGGRPYARGTDYHPGGLALVGEKEPELLNLPRGTSVTPLSQVGVGGKGLVIQNYFGADSVRSERDIYRIAENQEKAFRLRGVRTL